MNPEEATDQPATSFPLDFAKRKGLMNSPDENLEKIRTDRWLTTWDRQVKGMPSMEFTSEERSPNFYG
jgi:hypothetical protein